MSLGVLNNLSAVYAENNLSNTNNSLSKTLQQLSSGSKINSGADDAAGLSLVDGLQANQIGAHTVAEPTLRKASVCCRSPMALCRRSPACSTAPSRWLPKPRTARSTLRRTTAANQEYQSILSEISNIGSTTTYNQKKVFGGTDVAIYTGDSSTAGASQDDLHLAQVTSASCRRYRWHDAIQWRSKTCLSVPVELPQAPAPQLVGKPLPSTFGIL